MVLESNPIDEVSLGIDINALLLSKGETTHKILSALRARVRSSRCSDIYNLCWQLKKVEPLYVIVSFSDLEEFFSILQKAGVGKITKSKGRVVFHWEWFLMPLFVKGQCVGVAYEKRLKFIVKPHAFGAFLKRCGKLEIELLKQVLPHVPKLSVIFFTPPPFNKETLVYEETLVYGETIEAMLEAYRYFNSINSVFDLMTYALSIASDAQATLALGNFNQARQFMNKSKFFILKARDLLVDRNGHRNF